MIRFLGCGAARSVARCRFATLIAAVGIVAASGCASTEDEVTAEIGDPSSDPAGVAETAAPSVGTVEVGRTSYRFAVDCHELGAGELVAIGVGSEDGSGDLVEMYLQAFPRDPYVGLRFADGTLIEPSLNSSLNLHLQDDVIRASAIRFVKDLDLETGAATEVGFGQLEIFCNDYVKGFPVEPASGT